MARMSAAASWSYSAVATLWALQSRAGWSGALQFAAPVAIACDYTSDSKRMTDDAGQEFVSNLVLYTERAGIKQGDRVLIGASTAADPIAAGAVEVRRVMRYGDTLDRQADDYMVATS